MKTKIVGMLVCMLVIATAIPAVGFLNIDYKEIDNPLYFPGMEWDKTYGGPKADKFWAVQQTIDDGYIACGTTDPLIPSKTSHCPWIVKTDENGDEQWNWTIHDFTYNDTVYNITYSWCDDVKQISDGGYIACFMLKFVHNLEEHNVGGVVKLDGNGAQEWLQLFGDVFEWTILPEELLIVNDGILGVGSKCPILNVGVVNRASCLFKINNLGVLQWHQAYDKSPIYDWLRSLCSADDGYLLVGDMGVIAGVEYHAHIIKTDSNGIEEWNKTISDGEGFNRVQPTADGYILTGSTNTYGAGGNDAWVVKIDTDGNRIWNKTFGTTGLDYGDDLDVTNDDCFIITTIISWGMSAEAWIIKFDSDGNVLWEEIYDESSPQYLRGICSTTDGGCIAAGNLGPADGSTSDGLLVKYASFPALELELKSGIGVKVTITNSGGDATDVPWEITVQGGILGLIDKTFNGTISILTGSSATIATGMLLGLGSITVNVTVGFNTITVDGTQLFILTLLKP